MCDKLKTLGLGELKNAIRRRSEVPSELVQWLEHAVSRPGVCEAIGRLVTGSDARDRSLARILRSALLRCLCPPDNPAGVWTHKTRQALVLAVGEAFGGGAHTPIIAKMEQLWGWRCCWVDPDNKPPLVLAGAQVDRSRTKKMHLGDD